MTSQRWRISWRWTPLLLVCIAWPTAVAQPQSTPRQERQKFLAHSVFNQVQPPPGAVLHGGGGGNSHDYEEWDQNIETALTPTQVLEYYAGELGKLGWTFGEVMEDGSITLVTGNTREQQGGPRHALLLASQSAAKEGYVGMVIRLTKRVTRGPEAGKAG